MRRIGVVAFAALTLGSLAAGSGAASAASQPVRLAANIVGPTSSLVGRSVSFSLAKSTVPKGDKVASYSLTYGDGSKTVSSKGGEPRSKTHTFSKVGTFTVKLSITDIKHRTSTATTRVRITPPPTATTVAITSIADPVTAGSVEHATATSRPGDTCDLEITLPSGRQSTEAGLGDQTAGPDGIASWSWTITSNTGAGIGRATLTCGAGSATRTFTIN